MDSMRSFCAVEIEVEDLFGELGAGERALFEGDPEKGEEVWVIFFLSTASRVAAGLGPEEVLLGSCSSAIVHWQCGDFAGR
jgi:hypothetical protein